LATEPVLDETAICLAIAKLDRTKPIGASLSDKVVVSYPGHAIRQGCVGDQCERRPYSCLATASPSSTTRWLETHNRASCDRLEQLSQQKSTTSLVVFDGTPGREGVKFLYAARLGSPSPESEGTLWLESVVAAAELDANGKRLLGLCANWASDQLAKASPRSNS
jgi:hypothetical protein